MHGPIPAITSDVDDPQPLSPAMLLTMKTRPLGPPPDKFARTDLYACHWWRRMEYLADQFWLRLKKEYLQGLQPRKKWQESQRDIADGDIVLVREEDQFRNDWPLVRVSKIKKRAKIAMSVVQKLQCSRKKETDSPAPHQGPSPVGTNLKWQTLNCYL